MSKDIWVYIEQVNGKALGVSLELLGEAVRLKKAMKSPGQVTAVVIGNKVKKIVEEVLEYGAEKVYVASDERLKLYHPEYYARILERLIKENNPHIFLIGATCLGSQLAPMVAAKVKTGVMAHCVELKINSEDNLVAVVPAFGGKVLGDILCPKQRPQMATIKPGILPKQEKLPTKGNIININLDFLSQIKTRLEPINMCWEEPQGLPLEEAEIVICGGWGVGNKENWQILEKIAQKVGGAVACTRPPVDEGWVEGEHLMVGTSGKSIRPKIYIGFGISGATHHVCGMKDSELIISINNDEKAEIFNVSDYGLVGDINEILPLLKEALT